MTPDGSLPHKDVRKVNADFKGQPANGRVYLTEAQLGAAMLAHARAEGKTATLPPDRRSAAAGARRGGMASRGGGRRKATP